MAGKTRYVRLKNGKVDQVNNVVSISYATLDVVDGTYRDSPPVIVGGASAAASSYTTSPNTPSAGLTEVINLSPVSAQVSGGVNPVSSATGVATATASGASSVLQDDAYLHVAPRPKTTPCALLVITTDDGIATYDCIWKWNEVISVTNAPPPGWVVTESR